MKKLLVALLCLLPLSAQAQTSKSGLATEINTNLPDNAVGAITPALVRTTLIDMVNSWLDLNGTSGFNCGVNTWINAYSNLSTPSCAQPAFTNLSGNIAISQIAGGTGASNTTFLRGDNVWTTPAGAGTVTQYNNTAGTGLTTSGNCSVTSNNNASPCQYALTAGRQTLPTTSVVTLTSHTGGFSANGSGTYTTPNNALWIEITIVGGGGGGGGGNNATVAGNGGATCWNTTGSACTTPVYSAGGGGGTGQGAPGAGGVVTGSGTCLIPLTGGVGTSGQANSTSQQGAAGGSGGVSILGGAGGSAWSTTGVSAAANSGSGGGGGGGVSASIFVAGGGGSAAAACKTIISTPAATYIYAVGAGGTGAAAGAGGAAGGNGGSGQIIVIEHYGS